MADQPLDLGTPEQHRELDRQIRNLATVCWSAHPNNPDRKRCPRCSQPLSVAEAVGNRAHLCAVAG